MAIYSFLLLLLSANSQATLLCFHSEGCAPCLQMVPIVNRLEKAGYPTRHIDVQQNPQIATQFGIEGVPAFLLVEGNRELDRVVGLASFARLEQMFKVASEGRAKSDSLDSIPLSQRPPSSSNHQGIGSHRPAIVQRALEATVRIRVDNAREQSVGTGTIIDTHGDEALVVTCGHLFRDSQGRGPISVELFTPGAKRPVAGQLIAYEAKDRDIALLSIRPGVAVKPVTVVSSGHRVSPGDHVFSIGCDKGANPTVRTSAVTAINKFLGAPNVEVAGQPVDGRSGGGLFDAEGRLIAVCNAADAEDNEGVYASWPNIHWQLAQVGLGNLFAEQAGVAELTARPKNLVTSTAAPPAMPPRMTEPGRRPRPADSIAPRENSVVPVALRDGIEADTELILVVRSRSNPAAPTQSFVIHDPTAEFLERVAMESQRTANLSRTANSKTAPPEPQDSWQQLSRGQRGRVVRAQSDEN